MPSPSSCDHLKADWRSVWYQFAVSSQHGHPSGTNVVDLGCYRSNTPGLAASQLHVDLCVSDRCFAFICGQNSSTGLKKEEKCVMDILKKVKILSCLI